MNKTLDNSKFSVQVQRIHEKIDFTLWDSPHYKSPIHIENVPIDQDEEFKKHWKSIDEMIEKEQ